MPTLNWIGREAVINHHNEIPYRLLRCNGTLSAGNSGNGNLLVEGDNLEEKLPQAIPAFRLLVSRCLRVVPDPRPEDLVIYAGAADPKDLPILVVAVREACPRLVTFNAPHFRPGLPDVTVLRPGDFVLHIRDRLAGLALAEET